MDWSAALPTFYNDWSGEYADRFCNELDEKPMDRELLRAFARRMGTRPVLDLGCGPGHIGAFVDNLGPTVTGMDISPGMVSLARQRYPTRKFLVGSFYDLETTEPYQGIIAFYSLIHAEPDRLVEVLERVRVALCRGGELLASFHEGKGFATREDIRFHFIDANRLTASLRLAGFRDVEVKVRASYPIEAGEHRRLYVTALA